MGCLWSLFKGLIYMALLALLLAGGFVGNMAYEELFHAPWDQILGIENHRRDLSQIHARLSSTIKGGRHAPRANPEP